MNEDKQPRRTKAVIETKIFSVQQNAQQNVSILLMVMFAWSQKAITGTKAPTFEGTSKERAPQMHPHLQCTRKWIPIVRSCGVLLDPGNLRYVSTTKISPYKTTIAYGQENAHSTSRQIRVFFSHPFWVARGGGQDHGFGHPHTPAQPPSWRTSSSQSITRSIVSCEFV